MQFLRGTQVGIMGGLRRKEGPEVFSRSAKLDVRSKPRLLPTAINGNASKAADADFDAPVDSILGTAGAAEIRPAIIEPVAVNVIALLPLRRQQYFAVHVSPANKGPGPARSHHSPSVSAVAVPAKAIHGCKVFIVKDREVSAGQGNCFHSDSRYQTISEWQAFSRAFYKSLREAIGEDSLIKEIGHPAGREGGGGSAPEVAHSPSDARFGVASLHFPR